MLMNGTAILDWNNSVVHCTTTRLCCIVVNLKPYKRPKQPHIIEHSLVFWMVLVSTGKCVKNTVISGLPEIQIKQKTPCHTVDLQSTVKKLHTCDWWVNIFEIWALGVAWSTYAVSGKWFRGARVEVPERIVVSLLDKFSVERSEYKFESGDNLRLRIWAALNWAHPHIIFILFVEEKTTVVDLFGRVIVCWARSWVDIPEADALFELFTDWTIVCFSVVVLLHFSVCGEEN